MAAEMQGLGTMPQPPISAAPACLEGSSPAAAQEGHVCPGMLAAFRKRKSSHGLQEQWKQLGAAQAERALGIRAIPRTLSVGESGRSSATLGTSSAEEWLQQAAGESDNDGDSPASMLRYQLMEGQARKAGDENKRQRISSVTPDNAPAIPPPCNAPLVKPAQHIGGSTPECLDRLSAAACTEPARSLERGCLAANQLSAEDEQLSLSEDPDSSPDSCFDSAFIPAGRGGDPQQAAKHAAPAQVPLAPVLAPGKVYRFGCLRSRSRLSVTDSGSVQPPLLPESLRQADLGHAALACQPHGPLLQAPQRERPLDQGLSAGQAQQRLHCNPQPVPQAMAAPQTGNPTMAVANLIAGHSLARLPPHELALLIANHDGSDPALTQALQCAMSALSDAQLGNVGIALQNLNRALRGPRAGGAQPQPKQLQQQRAVPSACRLQPGCQHPAGFQDRAGLASKGHALPIVRIGRPTLPAQAQLQLQLCRQLQEGLCPFAASQRISWLQVLTMWSKGTDMVQADTPAFALHLWTRVQPLVSVRNVAAMGACKPWETIALACLWLAAKHEEARRALPPASRLAPLASCNARVLCAVEIHVLELLKWAPLTLWDDALHSKGIRFGP